MKQPNYITPSGFKALQDEFEKLFHGERPRVVETVAWAASNGDRSENGDYIYGKKRLREIDRRLRFLTNRIEAARVVDPGEVDSEKIVFGATVTLLNEESQERIYQIVGEDEIDTPAGKISWRSPMAKGLLGKGVGDEVLVKKPNGEAFFEVIRVEFLA